MDEEQKYLEALKTKAKAEDLVLKAVKYHLNDSTTQFGGIEPASYISRREAYVYPNGHVTNWIKYTQTFRA